MKIKLKSIRILTVFVCVLCMLIVCLIFNLQNIAADADSNGEVNVEQERDNEILNYYQQPTINENFEDNAVNVILKSGFSGEVGFDNFMAVDKLYGITSITYNLKTIYKGSNEKFTIDRNKNAILTMKLSINDKATILEAIKQLQKLDMVLVAEPNYIYRAVSDWTPDDPHLADTYYQWGISGSNGIMAEKAWDYTKGNTDIKVGVMEDAVDMEHEDLKGRVFSGNVNMSNATPNDVIHGTMVAGVIGAVKNNGIGITGVADCTMYLLAWASFAESLEYASQNGIKIINASFHFQKSSTDNTYAPYNAAHYTAIKNYDGLLVCAAGNDKTNIDNTPIYPACYDLPNVISVGAINLNGSRFSASNYGIKTVDIYAPGNELVSTYPASYCLTGTCASSETPHFYNGYHLTGGTSFSAPYVTGVAALLLSLNRNISASQLRNIILDNADSINIKNNVGFLHNAKRLNAYKAVSALNDTLNANKSKTFKFVVDQVHAMQSVATMAEPSLGYGNTYTYTAPESMTHTNDSGTKDVRNFTQWRMILNGPDAYDQFTNPWIDFSTDRTLSFYVGDIINNYYPLCESTDKIYFRAIYKTSPPSSCLAEDSLITLADGSQKLVKELTGEESLLVWNLFTGTFDTAPILCIDSEPLTLNEVINLYFSDGTTVKVISEHGFYDLNLNKYVYLKNDASQYIGHWFVKQDIVNDESYTAEVQLTNVLIQEEYTTAWSPVTYGHLCYFVNGMLSMPGGLDGLFNIFEVDSETLKFDEAAYMQDIETYGLYSYEEFNDILPVSEELFNAVNGQYLKVAIGKGIIDFDILADYVERYARLFE